MIVQLGMESWGLSDLLPLGVNMFYSDQTLVKFSLYFEIQESQYRCIHTSFHACYCCQSGLTSSDILFDFEHHAVSYLIPPTQQLCFTSPKILSHAQITSFCYQSLLILQIQHVKNLIIRSQLKCYSCRIQCGPKLKPKIPSFYSGQSKNQGSSVEVRKQYLDSTAETQPLQGSQVD